jgi:predicted nuclease of predicted toxin-antitoxin system
MPESGLHILLDQNVPQECTRWLQQVRPDWTVTHVNLIGLMGRSDAEVFRWAQVNQSIIISYDEDFADARMFPLGAHGGIIRLRVWPTTVDVTIAGLKRVLDQVPEEDWRRSLIIVDNQRIRLRRAPVR